MAQHTKIEWTDHTFNPWWGCSKVSPACDHCYAEAWAKRTGHRVWGQRAPRRHLSDAYWKQPLRWNRQAQAARRRHRVFCASMADVFEWRADLKPARARLWQLIEDTPHLDWLLLTKRPHLAQRLAPWRGEWPAGVWLGATVESQKFAASRIAPLADSGARTTFVSCEPLLGPLDLRGWLRAGAIDWVIAGGESGGCARPCDPAWLRGLRDQCAAAGTPFHFKQWGDWLPLEGEAQRTEAPAARVLRDRRYSVPFVRRGKKRCGRELDGRHWDDAPGSVRV